VQVIPENKHATRFTEQKFGQYTGTIDTAVYCFHSDVQYDHGDSDQLDWNKIGIFKTKQFDAHTKAFMLGWRNALNDSSYTHQIAFYAHGVIDFQLPHKVVGSYEGHVSNEYITVHPGGCFTAITHINQNLVAQSLESHTTGDYLSNVILYKDDWPEKYYLGAPWFGGNNKATQRMTFFTLRGTERELSK